MPWIWFQDVYDPPGNKLDMLQLAGITRPTGNQSLSQAVLSAYQHAGAHRVIDNKVSNLTTPFTGAFGVLRHVGASLIHGPTAWLQCWCVPTISSTWCRRWV